MAQLLRAFYCTAKLMGAGAEPMLKKVPVTPVPVTGAVTKVRPIKPDPNNLEPSGS